LGHPRALLPTKQANTALFRASQGAVMQQNNSPLLILKVLWACFVILTLTRLSVGYEATLWNGLALTEAEYIAALDNSPAQHPRLVQAH
jgi:hypothetical protein